MTERSHVVVELHHCNGDISVRVYKNVKEAPTSVRDIDPEYKVTSIDWYVCTCNKPVDHVLQ